MYPIIHSNHYSTSWEHQRSETAVLNLDSSFVFSVLLHFLVTIEFVQWDVESQAGKWVEHLNIKDMPSQTFVAKKKLSHKYTA